MDFSHLLFKPDTEESLVHEVIAEVQNHLHTNQNGYFFLKLEKCENEIVQIVWIKSFPDQHTYWDFIMDTKFHRACILIKIHGDMKSILLQGFFLNNQYTVRPHSFETGRPYKHSCDVETISMPPRELLEGAYAEFQSLVSSAKGNVTQ